MATRVRLSLLLAPLVTGVIMDRYGEWRYQRGGDPSFLGTFFGGALFALGLAAVRFWTFRDLA